MLNLLAIAGLAIAGFGVFVIAQAVSATIRHEACW
jgi:hypothetical protein